MICTVLIGINIFADMREHRNSAGFSYALARGLIIAVNAGKSLTVIRKISRKVTVRLGRCHVKLYALRNIQHSVLMRSLGRRRSSALIGFIFLICQRNNGSHMRSIILNKSDKRNQIGLLIPALVYRSVIRQRNNIIVEVIVHLNRFFNREISVAGVCMAVRLKFVASPLIPINLLIGIYNDVLFPFCRYTDYKKLCGKNNAQKYC